MRFVPCFHEQGVVEDEFQNEMREMQEKRRSSVLTTSTWNSFMTLHDEDAHTYTYKSKQSTAPSDISSSNQLTELPNSTSSQLQQPTQEPFDLKHSQVFHSASIRVLKQSRVLRIFVPRVLRVQTGLHPFVEYARTDDGTARKRQRLQITTVVERLENYQLLIDFQPDVHTDGSMPQDDQSPDMSKLTASFRNFGIGKDRPAKTDKWVFRFANKRERDVWARKIQDAIDMLMWISKFSLGNVLMESPSSSILECFCWMDQTKPSYVFKVLTSKSKVDYLTARNEVNVHQHLTRYSSHPNVLNLHDYYRQMDKTYLVLEYCAGGDLFEYLKQEGAMPERQARIMFGRLMEAIKYVHEHGVVHLDIKPENVFFKTSRKHVESIKLGDFGSARTLSDNASMKNLTIGCTIGYAAPEVLSQGTVSFAADVFSAGALLYTVLAGMTPFADLTEQRTKRRTLAGDFSFEDSRWWQISKSAQDLIRGMLEVDLAKRLTVEQVLSHPWLTKQNRLNVRLTA